MLFSQRGTSNRVAFPGASTYLGLLGSHNGPIDSQLCVATSLSPPAGSRTEFNNGRHTMQSKHWKLMIPQGRVSSQSLITKERIRAKGTHAPGTYDDCGTPATDGNCEGEAYSRVHVYRALYVRRSGGVGVRRPEGLHCTLHYTCTLGMAICQMPLGFCATFPSVPI